MIIHCRTCNRGTGLLIPVYPIVSPMAYDCFPCLWGELLRCDTSPRRWAEIREQLEHALIATPGLPIERREEVLEPVTNLSDLLPLFKDLHYKQEIASDVFRTIDDLIRKDGYSLYWDDSEERYCIYPLPKRLEELPEE